MENFWQTFLIAIIPAVITGLVSYIVSKNNTKTQIKLLEESNQHEIEKLMQQNKIDIEQIKETHKLEMEAKEQEHKNKLELQKNEFENLLLKTQKEGENVAMVEGIRGIFGMVGNALNTPEGQKMISDSIKQSRLNKDKQLKDNNGEDE